MASIAAAASYCTAYVESRWLIAQLTEVVRTFSSHDFFTLNSLQVATSIVIILAVSIIIKKLSEPHIRILLVHLELILGSKE
jgi:hypothetical protein